MIDEKKEKEDKKAVENEPFPVDFTSFILSMAAAGSMHLGQLLPGGNKEVKKDLAQARRVIDTLAVLEEKTRGNLTDEESKILEQILYELRMQYVKESKGEDQK